MFRLLVFGDICITKLDIYKILGFSCVAETVELANMRITRPDIVMYLVGVW